MKRSILFVIITFLTVAAVSALDFGFNLTTANTFMEKGDIQFIFKTRNTASAFVSVPTGSVGTFYVSGDARFYGDFPIKPKGKEVILPISRVFRLNRTDWSGNASIRNIGLNWAVGRTFFSDSNVRVFNGLLDGFKFGVVLPKTSLSFATAYTGLTYKNDISVFIDEDDIASDLNPNNILAPQRLVLNFAAQFPEVFPSHAIGFDLIGQFDLQGGKWTTHTQYLLYYINGKIGKNMNWKFWGVNEFGQDPNFFYSMAAGFSFGFFKPEWLLFNLKTALEWAAGDYDGDGAMRGYTSVTSIPVGVIYDKTFKDVLAASLTTDIHPVHDLKTGLSYVLLLRPNGKNERTYIGSELSGSIMYSINNDLDMSFVSGFFVPNRSQFRWLTHIAFTLHL